MHQAVTGSARRVETKPFHCRVDRDGDGVRITLEGELDLASAPEVQAALRDRGDDGAPRVLDLRGLTFMDSSGLRTILSAHNASRREGWALQIVAGPPSVQRVFDICGVTDGLRFIDQ